jgi:3-oxoacyl-[acyl-carrier-protein] synthase II
VSRYPREVCVTGLGVVSALGAGVATTYAGVTAGRSGRCALAGLGALSETALEGYPVAVDGASLAVTGGLLRYLSPAMRLLRWATLEAVAMARLDAVTRALHAFGIAIGAYAGERPSAAELVALERAGAPPDGARYRGALVERSPLSALRAQPGLLAGMLSQLHHAHGPCLTFIDEHVAGARAVRQAAEAVTDGWCEAWVAAGVFDLDDPWLLLRRAATPPALGSAAAVLVLESRRRARTRGVRVLATLHLDDTGAAASARRDAACVSMRRGRVLAGPLADRRLDDQLGDTQAAAAPLALALAVWSVRAGAASAPARVRLTEEP